MNSFNAIRRFPLSAALAIMVLLVIVQGCGSTSGTAIDEAPAPPPLTAEQTSLNLDSFDMVWTTIRDKHWDPELGGLDWPAVKDELRPQIEAATTMGEARGVMIDLIHRLGQSHFGIFPASVYDDAAASTGESSDEDKPHGRDGATGLDVRVRDGQTLVVAVQPDSPADEAGVKPGWELLSVGETILATRVEKLAASMQDKSSKGLMLSMSMKARLIGGIGEVMPMVLRDGSGQEVELELELVEGRGTKTTLGNLPAVRVWHETRTLPGDIGYFRFNFFLGIMEVMPAYNEAMQSFLDAKAIIIDLRGNPGGLGAMAMGMSGWFIEGRGHQLGVMTLRTGDLKFIINPRANRFQGLLALLVDDLSASTAEIMAGGLQDLGRAKLFGVTSAGAALPSVIDKLPNGDGFQYAIANYVSAGGLELEGHGVKPDFEIVATRELLLQEGDPVLKAAIAWIESQ